MNVRPAAIRDGKKKSTFVDKSTKRLEFLASALPLQRDTRYFTRVMDFLRRLLCFWRLMGPHDLLFLSLMEHLQRTGKNGVRPFSALYWSLETFNEANLWHLEGCGVLPES